MPKDISKLLITKDSILPLTQEEFIKEHQTIQELTVRELKIEEQNQIIYILPLIAYNYHLKHLSISGCRGVSLANVEMLAEGLKANNSLNKAWFFGNGLGDEGASKILAALKGKKHFKGLSLYSEGLTNASAVNIAEFLQANPNLAELNLGLNLFNHETTGYLAPFINKSNLISFRFASAEIVHSDYKSCIEHVIEMFDGNKSLTTIKSTFHQKNDRDLDQKLLIALEANHYITWIFGHDYRMNYQENINNIEIILEGNKHNVESIQAVIQKAITYCANHQQNLTAEELDILTNKDKDFVKAQLNAHPEWLEIEGREPLEVEEFLHEIEQYFVDTTLAGITDVLV
ncbi:MAG: hypothetical protein K0R02_508 [Rickettsiaceae bacterium]|jgi:hypothetical protein|nr:hypothetical protein [Rickettsiaceae bacterium]